MTALLNGIAALRSGRRVDPRAPSRTPRVSVVVPCYNYGHYLPACVGSALNQPGVNVEAIVVDDASPDGSGEVAEQLFADDPRVRPADSSEDDGVRVRTLDRLDDQVEAFDLTGLIGPAE